MLAGLLARCHFPPPATPVTCGFSGGADSTALVALAQAAGCAVTAVLVDHGLRPSSREEAARAEDVARALGVELRVHRVDVAPGPNVEERARDVRRRVLGPDALLGHTADDRAESVLINLLRGAGATGLATMGPAPTRPILALRRSETRAVCAFLRLDPVEDPSNTDGRFVRNRIRHEVLPLLADVAGRDVVPLLTRTAELLAADARALDDATRGFVTADARVVAALPDELAGVVVRRWLLAEGVRADRAGVERVLAVARGTHRACELAGGQRVERHLQRLRIVEGRPVE
jgi:tRNA(Ile)-lysidine synthase